MSAIRSPDLHLHLIDSHVHLNFTSYEGDLDDVAQRWRRAGVAQLVHSCCSPAEFAQLQAIADRFPEVSLAVGLHPLDVDNWVPDMGAQIGQLATSDPRVVAIGETGLDFYKADNANDQLEVFDRHIAIAAELDLPLIVHCRDAAEAARTCLQSTPVRGVMHCWSGTPEETRWFIDMGFYISFSGIVTFKNAGLLREAVLEVPSDRLLIETDCPFLAPVPYRGKRNEPAFVAEVAQTLADIRGLSVQALASLTTDNARALFRLPGHQVADAA